MLEISPSTWLLIVTAVIAIFGSTALLLLFLARPLHALRRATDFAARLDSQRGQQLPPFRGNLEIRGLVEALNRASLRLKNQEETIAESNRFLNSLTDALGEGVIATDAEGRCTFVNAEAEQLLGWSRQELLGQAVHELIHYQTATGLKVDREECPLHASAVASRAFRSDLDAFTRKDGSTFPISVVSVPLFEAERFAGTARYETEFEVPTGVAAGMVTVVVPVDVALGARAATLRLPVSTRSPVLRTRSSDR